MHNQTVSTDEFHKEIDLIQGCITRMAQNSFMIKGWAYTLIAAIVALTAERLDLFVLCSIGIFILFVFWYLDAFFLKTEKLYRFKYEWVIVKRPEGNREHLYDLNPTQKGTMMDNRKEPSVISVMFSPPCTLLAFYGSPILVGIIISVVKALYCLV